MDRRTFLGAASATIIAQSFHSAVSFAQSRSPLKPMDLGLLISPFGAPEATFKRVHDIGFTNCFLSLDGYINGFTRRWRTSSGLCSQIFPGGNDRGSGRPAAAGVELYARSFHHRSGTAEDPRRANRCAAPGFRLRQAAGIPQVQTHCGFIPEDPADPLYPGAVEAIRRSHSIASANGQYFLMETGQETPTTMSRMLRDVAMPNLAVGLDTANLILYGKANPVDAVDIIGRTCAAFTPKTAAGPPTPASSVRKC